MKERRITEFFHLAMGQKKEAEGWWKKNLISPGIIYHQAREPR
jgi:hypothetical protein